MPKGKKGPIPQDKNDQKTNGEDHSAEKPVPIRCAGCESTEVTHVDAEGFHYDEKCISSSRAEVRLLDAEELEKVRAQNSAAGVPLTPEKDLAALDTTEQRPEDRDAEGKEPKRIPPFPRATTKVLPVKLNETEVNAFKSRLSDQVATMIENEEAKKQADAEYNELIKEAKKEIRELHLMIKNSVKHEAIDCEWRPNWEENCKELVRLDTSEIVDRQPLDWEDRQLELKDVSDQNQNQQQEAPAQPSGAQSIPETVQEQAGEKAAS